MTGKTRVHEIARDLGVDSQDVLRWLKQNGEFVKSASSQLEGPVVRRLREAFRAPPTATGDAALLQYLTGKPAPPRPTFDHPPRAGSDAAAPPRRPLAARRVPATRPRPLMSDAKALAEQWAGGPQNRIRAEQFHNGIQEWLGRFFTLADVRTWRAAGLSVFESHLALQCIAEELAPSDLQRRVDGLRVVERLRSGESCAVVAGRLRAA